jgi:hypothetical protein
LVPSLLKRLPIAQDLHARVEAAARLLRNALEEETG